MDSLFVAPKIEVKVSTNHSTEQKNRKFSICRKVKHLSYLFVNLLN